MVSYPRFMMPSHPQTAAPIAAWAGEDTCQPDKQYSSDLFLSDSDTLLGLKARSF